MPKKYTCIFLLYSLCGGFLQYLGLYLKIVFSDESGLEYMHQIGCWYHEMSILRIKVATEIQNDILNGKYSKYVDNLENLKCYSDSVWLPPSKCVDLTKFIFWPRFITKCSFSQTQRYQNLDQDNLQCLPNSCVHWGYFISYMPVSFSFICIFSVQFNCFCYKWNIVPGNSNVECAQWNVRNK